MKKKEWKEKKEKEKGTVTADLLSLQMFTFICISPTFFLKEASGTTHAFPNTPILFYFFKNPVTKQ